MTVAVYSREVDLTHTTSKRCCTAEMHSNKGKPSRHPKAACELCSVGGCRLWSINWVSFVRSKFPEADKHNEPLSESESELFIKRESAKIPIILTSVNKGPIQSLVKGWWLLHFRVMVMHTVQEIFVVWHYHRTPFLAHYVWFWWRHLRLQPSDHLLTTNRLINSENNGQKQPHINNHQKKNKKQKNPLQIH